MSLCLGLGLGVGCGRWEAGWRVWGFGFAVWVVGCGALGLRFGFGVWSLGVDVAGLRRGMRGLVMKGLTPQHMWKCHSATFHSI